VFVGPGPGRRAGDADLGGGDAAGGGLGRGQADRGDLGVGEHHRFPVPSSYGAAGLPLEPQEPEHRELGSLRAGSGHAGPGAQRLLDQLACRTAHLVPAGEVRAREEAEDPGLRVRGT
jgi:hypothetical protein